MNASRRIAIALAGLLLAAPLALAEDHDEDRPDKASREVKLDVSSGKMSIGMEREAGGIEDEVKVEYDAPAGTLKVEYETENATHETETELKVRFERIVEFRDADGDGAYDAGEAIVGGYGIEELDWSVEGPDPVTSTSGVPGHQVTGRGAFPDGGELAFVFYVYGEFARMNGTDLRPSDVKIDILVADLPFEAEDTLIALFVRSEQETEVEVEGDEDGMSAKAGDLAAVFTWADVAIVDGVEKPVRTTVLETEADEGEKESRVVFAYPRGALVNHDPVLGIQSASAKAVPAPGAWGLVAVVAAAALVLGRRGA